MLQKIDHIGIAVRNLDEAIKTYRKLGFKLTGYDRVETQKVEIAFFQLGESRIELIAATEPNSPIAKFIEKNAGKGGLQQLAIAVTDIEGELARLKANGFTLINESPVPGANGSKVAFVHPRDTDGVLLELCETTENANEDCSNNTLSD